MLPATHLTAVPHYLSVYIPAIFQRDNLHPGGGWVWRECGLPVAHLRPVHHRDDDKVLVLETKVIRMFPKISQSRRRPLLGPSPG